MSLAEASEARKARLIALRKRKEGEDDGEPVPPLIKNRNFDPESRTLKKHKADDIDVEDTVEHLAESMAAQIMIDDEKRRAQELDVFNIAPKRPNWDLKRELSKKLAKLERKTQESIHILIRQRLASQKGESDDIIGAMKAQEQQDALSDEEE